MLRYLLCGMALTGFLVYCQAAQAAGLPKPTSTVSDWWDYTPANSYYKSTCYVEGSAGLGISDTELSDSEVSVKIADTGAVYGLGGGCDARTGPQMLVGVLGRVMWSDVKPAIGDIEADVKITYELAGRVGFLPAENLLVYGLAGASWMKGSSVGGEEWFTGFLVGAGTELMLNENAYIGGEFTATYYGKETPVADLGIEPTQYAVRAKLGWRF